MQINLSFSMPEISLKLAQKCSLFHDRFNSSGSRSNGCTLHLDWKVVLTIPVTQNVPSSAVQASTKRVSIAECDWYDIESQFVELLHLMDLARLCDNCFMIQNQDVH